MKRAVIKEANIFPQPLTCGGCRQSTNFEIFLLPGNSIGIMCRACHKSLTITLEEMPTQVEVTVRGIVLTRKA
jgi:hypothetical protein